MFQTKLFNNPATYPVKLDRPSRHPKSFIITKITIMVINVLLSPTTPYLIACFSAFILLSFYLVKNILFCYFLYVVDREAMLQEIAKLVASVEYLVKNGLYISLDRDQAEQTDIEILDLQAFDLAIGMGELEGHLIFDGLTLEGE